MTNEEQGRPLDHATARIVSELAAALLPSLKDSVGLELEKKLEKTLEAVSARTSQGAAEALASLKRLQKGAETLDEVLEAVKGSAGFARAVPEPIDLLPALSPVCERLEASAARLSSLVKEAEHVKEAGPDKPAEPELAPAAMLNMMSSLEAAISDWEGVLRANGRAQTREFSEFSIEVSELMKEMRSALPEVIREAAGKNLAARGEELARVTEQGKALEKKLARLERMLTVGGIVFSALLAFLSAMVAIALLR